MNKTRPDKGRKTPDIPHSAAPLLEKPAISCRAATLDDVPFLLALRETTMTDQLQAAGIDLSTKNTLKRVMHKFECAQIVMNYAEPIGLIKLDRSEHQWKLAQLQLSPAVQGQGIGTQLLKTVIQQAIDNKAQLTLSVLHNNPARHLYQSLGFTITGSDDHEYFMTLVY